MISTVTTVVSTIVSSAAASLILSLTAAGVLTLIASLVIKELAVTGGSRGRSMGRNLDVVVLPLLFVFSFVALMKVWEIFS